MDFLSEQDPKRRKRLKRETIEDLISIAEDCFCSGNSNYSLAFANSLLSLLAILVSEEFDNLLEGTSNAKRDEILIFSLIDQHSRRVQDQYALPAVRVFDELEKKIFCEPVKPGYSAWANVHTKQRILLSIDPYTAPEDAARLVKEIVVQWQEERFIEAKADWQENGYSDEQADDLAIRGFLDYPRSSDGKIPRTGDTLFSVWLRRLRVYRAHRAGVQYKEFSRFKWFGDSGKDQETTVKNASRDNQKAKELIKKALNGLPIFR